MAKSGQYSRSLLGASDEIKDIYCEPCGKDGTVAIAEGYCKDCPEYLCSQCYKSHRRNKVLANHVLLDKDSMPITLGSRKGVLDICEQKCITHSDKEVELFCETCDKLGCTICITIDHRQCGKVKHIPDIAKDLKNSLEFTAFQECIKSTTDKLSEFEQNIQADATSNNKMQKLAKQELQRQRAEINKFFDELEKEMDDQILTLEKRNKDILKKSSHKLKPIKKDLDHIKNDIEEKKTGKNSELFISMKKSKEKMKTFDDQLITMKEELTIKQYIPSEQIQTMMRNITEICRISTAEIKAEISRTPTARTTPEINRIPTARTSTEINRIPTARTTPEINRIPTARTTPEINRIPTARTTPEINRKQIARNTKEISRTPTARLVSVIDIKTSKDQSNPIIHSLAIMPGHYCVVADGNNKSIKVVDTKRKQVTSEMSIEANIIWSVTSVRHDQIVVSVSLSNGKKQIQFFSVSTSRVVQSTDQLHDVEDYYMDMVNCKDNIYGVHNDKIDILSMTGKISRTIQTDGNGAALFDDLVGIATNGQTLYVTDCTKNSVTSLTLDGKVNVIYTDKKLRDPCGIIVDKYGYVYVQSWGTKNIHQLTADLNKVQVLIEGVNGKSIAYSSSENKIYTNDNININKYFLDFEYTKQQDNLTKET